MTFKQKFGDTEIVQNIDNSNGDGNDNAIAFMQEYDRVRKVTNIENPDTIDEKTISLIELIGRMDESQLLKFANYVTVNAQDRNNPLRGGYGSLLGRINSNGNFKQGLIEYLKSGTAVISFVNALLSLAKIVLQKG